MSKHIKEYVYSALRVLMNPITLILVRNGVTYKEFCHFCKNIYVDVVSKHYGINGRPTNVSRISVITGIDRKEVKRIKDLLSDNADVTQAQQSQDRLTRLLSGWHQDAYFLDSKGQPLILTVDSGKKSFIQLCKRYGGDIPPHAVLKELIRAECVQYSDEKNVKVLKRYFFPANSSPESLLRAGTVVNELANTLYHNLYASQDQPKLGKRFERRASNNHISAKHVGAFSAFLDKEGQLFLEKVDAWLSEHEATEDDKVRETTVRLGVGVFTIEKASHDDEDE